MEKKNNTKFTHLHLHTPEGSLLDGFCRIDPMIELAQKFGMDSIGVSDHGTVYAHQEFYNKCKAAGIHPVLGMEGYIAPRKEYKKADFEGITYTDIRYISKEDLDPKPVITFQEMDDGTKEEVIQSVPSLFPDHVKLEKKEAQTFALNKPKTPEHVQFLRELEDRDPDEYASYKKSKRWYLCGIPNSKNKEFFEWFPQMAHLLMIAKTNEGYKNLLKLTSIGSLEGFYRKPRVDYRDVRKYGKGIVATSSCLGGSIPQLIENGRDDVAKKQIRFYQRCFDEFYLEIQPGTDPLQLALNKKLIEWSKEMDVPLIATSDAHMLRPEELPIHKALTNINKGKKDDDASDIDVYEHCIFYSTEEMVELGMPAEALQNAYDLAHSCHVDLDNTDIKYPEFEVPEGYDFDTYLEHLTYQHFIRKIEEGNFQGNTFFEMYHTYKERLDYELKIIKDKKISAYMLIVWDYVDFARKQQILVGPGRGSAAGSLVAFVLGIVNLDPIKYDLLFERFLNPERPGFPDIDTDFDYLRRHEVIEYVTEKYGDDKVAQIVTFGTLSTKTALRDIGRGLGIDHNELIDLNKFIPSFNGEVMPISEAMEKIPEVKKYAESYPRLFELGKQVESMHRSQGVHPCGVLIAPNPITDDVALIKGKTPGDRVTSYDGPTLEDKGFIKFDFLGLKNLSVIEICRRLVEERHGYLIDVDELIPNDSKALAMIKRGETDGLFQIESEGMKDMFKGMDTVTFDDLIAGVALYRPGPMEHIPTYLSRKNSGDEIDYPHPVIEEIAGNTFGLLIYQEQIMQLTGRLGGYSLKEQDLFRKAIGKKSQEVMDKELPALHKRITDQGHSSEIADWCLDKIEPFVGYGFNKSHAAAYGFIAYQTAYLKANYPIEYMTALLQVFFEDKDKVIKYVNTSKEMGYEVLPPDLNRSDIGFTIDGEKAIRFGLGSIKGLGERTLDAIIYERSDHVVPTVIDDDGLVIKLTIEEADQMLLEDPQIVFGEAEAGGLFTSITELMERIPKRILNKRSIRSLSLSGAFDSFMPEQIKNRLQLLYQVFKIRGDELSEEDNHMLVHYQDRFKYELESELLGVYVTGHILDRIAQPTRWEELDESLHATSVVIVEARVITTKKGDRMAFLAVETLEGMQSMILFPNQYETVADALVPGMILQVSIRAQMNWQKNQKDFIIHTAKAPKRINSQLWKTLETKDK